MGISFLILSNIFFVLCLKFWEYLGKFLGICGNVLGMRMEFIDGKKRVGGSVGNVLGMRVGMRFLDRRFDL